MNTIEKIYNLYKENHLVSTDTRNIIPNSIFFALKGENFNGNKYTLEAINKGAAWAICDENIFVHEQIIYVEDVLTTLQELALFHRKKLTIPIIGITGTNGKTTTKELINCVLSSKYNVLATKGNLNNHIGVPLTLLSITNKHNIAIVEMGANHIGEIADLCQISQPSFGIITNIGKAHLEGFGSIDGVIKTKKALYDFIIDNNGTLFVDADSELLTKISETANKITYGTIQGNTSGKILKNSPLISVIINNDFVVETNLVGTYNLKNILAAVCVGQYFNIPNVEIIEALKKYYPSNNRSQFIESSSNKIIMDAYNANPSSMNEAIQNINQIDHPNKILILGDMLELGRESLKEHRAIIDKIDTIENIKSIFVGKMFLDSDIDKKHNCFENINDAIQFIQNNPIIDSMILLKGSRGIKMEQILPYINI